MRLFSIVCAIVDSFDSIALADALTMTVSSSVPTTSGMLSVTVSAVRSVMPSRTHVLNPVSAALTRTGPGCSRCTVNTPSWLVTVSIDIPVSVLTTVTVTPGTTAPCASLTVPVMLARVSCAHAAAGSRTMTANSARMKRNEDPGKARVRLISPP
jgi:hypothetical protein